MDVVQPLVRIQVDLCEKLDHCSEKVTIHIYLPIRQCTSVESAYKLHDQPIIQVLEAPQMPVTCVLVLSLCSIYSKESSWLTSTHFEDTKN